MLSRGLIALFSRSRHFSQRAIFTSRIAFQESEDAVPPGKDQFLKAWDGKVLSALKQPNFASDWTEPKAKEPPTEDAKPSEIPKKIKLSFYMPSEIIMEQTEVDMALLPAVTGDFGVMPGHVPTMAQLRPGVISVHKELDKDVKKYFISGGFAFVHADSTTDVCVVEAAELEHLDKEAIKAGLAEYTAKLGSIQSGGDDYEIAAAQIGVDVYSAMDAAVP